MSESASKRLKRKPRTDVEDTWECTACTYKNPKESFKCEVCDTRKGTSTRKPKLTNSVIQMQEQLQKVFSKDRDEESVKKKSKDASVKLPSETEDNNKNSFTTYLKKIKNLDRQNFEKIEVSANGFSVVITEYLTKTSNIKSQSKTVSVCNTVSTSAKKDKSCKNLNRNIWSIAMDNMCSTQSETVSETSKSLSTTQGSVINNTENVDRMVHDLHSGSGKSESNDSEKIIPD